MRTRHGGEGLSLIEVLVSTGILAVALVALVGVFPTSYLNVVASGEQSKAAAYAQQELEVLKGQPLPAHDALPATGSDNPEGGKYQRSWRIVEIPDTKPPNRLASITVTVSWQGGRPHSLTLETMRAE